MLVVLFDHIWTVNLYSFLFFLRVTETLLELWLVWQVDAMVTTELSIHLHTAISFAVSATYSAEPLGNFFILAAGVNGHFLQRFSRSVPVAS